jgi:hypothetical protein
MGKGPMSGQNILFYSGDVAEWDGRWESRVIKEGRQREQPSVLMEATQE